MNRRNFLQFAALAIAGQAAVRVWPFRVYSIPSTICAPKIDLVGLNDIEYTHWNSTSGTFMNLKRSTYPGKLSTPGINSAMPTPESIRELQRQMIAALGHTTQTINFFPPDYFSR